MEVIEILCFGDSLTAGYSDYGMTNTPYGPWMVDLLEGAWPEREVHVSVAGQSGDLVGRPGTFLRRLTKKLDVTDTETPFYDWIIILGGTNDLGYGRDANTIFNSMTPLWELASSHGANVLHLTVPECHVRNADLDTRRRELNEMILNRKADRFYTLDLFTLMPYHSLSEKDKEEIWDDGLHFTPYGYELISMHVANRLIELVDTIGPNTSRNSKRAAILEKAGKA